MRGDVSVGLGALVPEESGEVDGFEGHVETVFVGEGEDGDHFLGALIHDGDEAGAVDFAPEEEVRARGVALVAEADEEVLGEQRLDLVFGHARAGDCSL